MHGAMVLRWAKDSKACVLDRGKKETSSQWVMLTGLLVRRPL